LAATALEALYAGIAVCAPGEPLTKIGHGIHKLARRRGASIFATLCGHGIGRHFHCAPDVYHVLNNYPGLMQPGMAFTVEPCLTFSPRRALSMDEGSWDLRTKDGSRTAQFEHTILVTADGVEILTA